MTRVPVSARAAPAASVPGPGNVASVRSKEAASKPGVERVCVSVSLWLAGSGAFQRRAGVRQGLREPVRPRRERHPARIRCRARAPTERDRERTESSGATHRSCRKPRKARSAGERGTLQSFLLPTSRPKKRDESNEEKKERKRAHRHFRKSNKTQACLSPAPLGGPDSTRQLH